MSTSTNYSLIISIKPIHPDPYPIHKIKKSTTPQDHYLPKQPKTSSITKLKMKNYSEKTPPKITHSKLIKNGNIPNKTDSIQYHNPPNKTILL